jgi:hypothetical protein
MKRKPRKLTLSRETIRSLADPSLRQAGGGSGSSCCWMCTSFHGCSEQCDTDWECSTGCDQPTNLWYVCG